MLDTYLWSRNGLPLPEAIEIASLFLKFAQSTSNLNALQLLCGNVSAILYAIKRSARQDLNPSLSAKDRELCENVASIFNEHGRLWERLKNTEKARSSFEKAGKWSISALTPSQAQPQGNNRVQRKIACVAPEIFIRDVCVRVTKPNLPTSDVRISSTPQLVYCLTLLNNITSSPEAVAITDDTFDETDRNWLQTMAEDADEQNRLRSLPGKLIAEFIDDDMKEPAAVTEIVSLAPVLTQTSYRKLLNHFIVSFEQAKLLEFGLVDGFAHLIQNAQGGHLLPSDLVSILKTLNARLQDTHQQSSKDLTWIA